MSDAESELSPLDAMERHLNAISSGNIDMLASSNTAEKRTASDAELDTPSRPGTPPGSANQSGSSDLSLVAVRRRPTALNPVQVAKNIVASKKRKTDHASELLAFAELSSVEREVAAFDLMIEVRNVLRYQYAENDSWSMSKNLKEDIRAYAQAFILAPAIPCYMPDALSIQNLLISKGVIPEAWTSFGSRLSIIRQYAGTCATDTHSDLKNALKTSLKSKACLSALCQTIVSNTELKVTAAFRLRVAWLRFIYANHPEKHAGKGFWEFVDEELRKLRNRMKNDATQLAFAMTYFANEDAKLYKTGIDEAYELADDKDLPQLQVAANAAAKAIIPPVPKAD